MSNWDKYFLTMTNAVASNSKCLSRKIGAVLVKDKSVISTGYNGPPRGVRKCHERAVSEFGSIHDQVLWDHLQDFDVPKGSHYSDFAQMIAYDELCPRQAMGFKSGEGLQWCPAGHAERNALINAARNGICTKGTKLYMNCPIPCTPCLVEIINAGVDEIVCTALTYYDVSAKYLLDEVDILVRPYMGIDE